MTPLPRVGVGVDVHAYAPDESERELWVGGLLWPGERGLDGHSDADVAAHAACATGLMTLVSMLTCCGRPMTKPTHSATSSATSGRSTPS